MTITTAMWNAALARITTLESQNKTLIAIIKMLYPRGLVTVADPISEAQEAEIKKLFDSLP